MKFIKKSVSLLLIMTMIVSLFTIIPLHASALDGGGYYDYYWNEDEQKLELQYKAIPYDSILISERTSDHLESGRYYYSDTNEKVTVNSRLYVDSGTVNIYLGSFSTLTLNGGICVAENATLNIYESNAGNGKLYSKYPKLPSGAALIGSDSGSNAGTINFYSGKIELYGSNQQDGAIIGGGKGGTPKEINIYKANITADGGWGAAIGSGSNYSGTNGTINIYGGTVKATGQCGGAGIGGGKNSSNGPINIFGGVISAAGVSSKKTGAGIGSGSNANQVAPIHIYGDKDGSIAAESTYGAGIGGGFKGNSGEIIIEHAGVNATSSAGGAAIGGGSEGDSGSIIINDSSIVAVSSNYDSAEDIIEKMNTYAGTIKKFTKATRTAAALISVIGVLIDLFNDDYSGAAIGGGYSGNSGTIKITNSDVRAECGDNAAAIGSGEEGGFDSIEITDCVNVEATSGKFGAAIGSGKEAKKCGTINITNSTVTATAGLDAAGIGTGSLAEQSAAINITGSTVTAHGGRSGAGIGGGGDVSGGTIKISGSTVHAYGGEDAAGIGGGEWGDGGHIEINNSNVYAEGKDYGAGIGGGEDSSGEYCSIVGNSTVEAVSGGKGNVQSIGHGDCGWYIPKYTSGVLYLAPTLKLNAGSNSGNTSTYIADSRYDAVWDNKYAKLYPCSHSQTEWRSRSATMHAVYCLECQGELEPMEYHEWDSELTCTVCGAKADPATLTLVERNNSGEITLTQSAASYSLITVPECTNTPDGYRFVCWKDNNDKRYLPGFSKDIRSGVTLTAVYLPVETTKYIDKNGDEQTVEACVIPDGYQYYLSDGWYVVKDNISTDATLNVKGAVNVIIADGKTFNYTYIRQLFSILANSNDTVLSIYGQKEQTGTINLNDGSIYAYYFKQYGARIQSESRGNIGAEYSINIFSGNVNVGRFISRDTTEIYGGNVVITDRSGYKKLELGWTNLHDSYTLNNVDYDSISIADGQAFTDGENIYQGNLSASEIELISGKTLVPYLSHVYADPEWVWDNEYREATAVFRCKDCDDVQEIKAKVTYEDSGKSRTVTARCMFNGQEYSTTQTFQIIFDITVANAAHGTVTANKATAKADDYIKLEITPDDGYALSKLYYTDTEENKTEIDGSGFIMPESDVTVRAEFASAIPATDPYIDSDGEYRLGNIEHFEIDGKNYAVNDDGSVGDELNSVEISYFDFALLSDDTYQIKSYTGPMDNLEQLEIPNTFNGKAITVLGEEDESFMKGTGTQHNFILVLNKNVTTIQGNAFFLCMLTAVEGDTSGLNQIKDKPFVWANLAGDSKIDFKLDYPGKITVDSDAFGMENVTVRLKHATTLSSEGNASSIEYIVTDDAHTYGEPVWTWADDYSSATAKFTCTDSRCKHEETVNATVTRAESEDNTIYIATAELDGETYTDVKGSYYIRILGSEHGTVMADKTHADEGETVNLTATPDDKYMLKSITVKDANGEAVTVTNNSFVMPAGGVTVSAEFGIRTANISVGGVGINVNNCADILGDGTASYDFDTNTLTLTNANIEAKSGTGIRYNESSTKPFNIVLNGENRIADDVDDASRTCYGIALYAAAPSFKISGNGTLNIEMNSDNPRVGIQARKALTIDGVSVSVDVLGSENAIGVDLVYSDSILKLDNAARMVINADGYALQSNRNVKNLNVSDDSFFEAISATQAFNENINLTDSHPTVIVNTEPSADGADTWDESTSLTSYKYIRMRGEDAPYWVNIVKPQHGTVTTDLNRSFAMEGESITLTTTPDSGYELELITITDEEGRTITGNKNSLTFAMPASDVTVTAAFTFADGVGARLLGHSISLEGDIAVNFYVELAPEIAQSETAYMLFNIPNTSKEYQSQKVYVKDLKSVEGGYYVFKCRVAAKDMTSTITAQIIDDGKQGTPYTYSVKEYADYLIEHKDDNEQYTKAAPLVEKMLQYGAYAKEYFDNTNTLADLDDVTIDIADPVITGLPEGTTFEGASLSLKSETTLSLFFNSNETLTFSCDGYNVETVQSGDYQIARIRGIKAKHIGDILTLNVNGGTVQYSPLNYCKNVLAPSTATPDEAQPQAQDDKLVNVVKALYLYWQAADSYFD